MNFSPLGDCSRQSIPANRRVRTGKNSQIVHLCVIRSPQHPQFTLERRARPPVLVGRAGWAGNCKGVARHVMPGRHSSPQNLLTYRSKSSSEKRHKPQLKSTTINGSGGVVMPIRGRKWRLRNRQRRVSNADFQVLVIEDQPLYGDVSTTRAASRDFFSKQTLVLVAGTLERAKHLLQTMS